MRRTAATLLLAVLLTLSGCSAITGGSGPQEAPPGVEDGRLVNATALTTAHTAALVESGFEHDIRTNATIARNGETFEVSRRQQTVVEPGAVEYQFRLINGGEGPSAQVDAWGNETTQVTRVQAGNQTQYGVGNPTPAAQLTTESRFTPYLASGNFTVENTETDGDVTLVTLVGGAPPGDANLLPSSAVGNLTDYEVRAVVDTQGRIHEFSVTGTYTVAGTEARFAFDYRLLRTDGPSVDQPEWAAEVLASR
ncbi:DUF7537 family lipoprotein [Natronomonas sp. EA1]|uniref:DUF7537 family lipoprotein n=1 Tax=Natronomonas sp. EA1 TaxID=3421655 RepID=UPI003EC129CB